MTPKDKLIPGHRFVNKHSGRVFVVTQPRGYDTQVYREEENSHRAYTNFANYVLLDEDHFEPLDYELDPL